VKIEKTEKLQKVLARLGFGSRRQLEQWIKHGRVTINGKIAKLGDRVSIADKIAINNKLIKIQPIQPRVLLYNKPEGEVCTRSDEKGRATVFDHLPKLKTGRWISIGRLDINSSGLLLFTNDGELAHCLMHPSSQIEREYLVRVFGQVDKKIIDDLLSGVVLSDGSAKFKSIQKLSKEGLNQWFRVVITEGRNRLVRRLWQAKKIVVNRLIRVRFYDILLPRSLDSGTYIELGTKDIHKLLNMEKRYGCRQKDFGRR
jgi:23S rRNA pseudouridine2605 synthase